MYPSLVGPGSLPDPLQRRHLQHRCLQSVLTLTVSWFVALGLVVVVLSG